ncbi:hypothetical protein ACHWQZ_G012750 [Mnemiopsis leidyi]
MADYQSGDTQVEQGYDSQHGQESYNQDQESYNQDQNYSEQKDVGYQEDNSGGYQNQNTPYNAGNQSRGRGRGRGDSRGGGFRGNTRGRGGSFDRGGGSFGRGGGRGGNAPRGGVSNTPRGGGGGFTGQKRSFQQDEFQGSLTGSMEFVKKRKINDNVYRILVPVRSVKSIIGPGGQNIKDLKASAGEGCKISIYTQGTNKVPLPEGTTERVVSIEGSTEQLKICLNEIVKNVQAAPFEKYRGKFILKLMVPEHTCSIVIGPKGANTKKIREETDTIVQLFRDPLPASGEHVVNLKNQDPEKLVDAALSVFEVIQDAKSKNNVLLYEPYMWTPGEFGTTGSYHDEEYEVYTRYGSNQQQQQQQQQPQQQQQQFYNNQGYGEDQTFYNEDYVDDQSFYNDQGYGNQGSQGGYEGDYSESYQDQGGYQEQSFEQQPQPAPTPRGGGGRGRARGPLLGSAPSPRGGPRGGGGAPQRGAAPRGGAPRGAAPRGGSNFGGRGGQQGQRGSFGGRGAARGASRGGNQQGSLAAPRGTGRGGFGSSRGRGGPPRGASRGRGEN